MKKALLAVLALLLMIQFGCTKSVRYTEEEIKSFPPITQEQIRKGEISLGMSQEHVRYAWGAPDSIKFLEAFDGKSREEWIYSQAGTLGVLGTRLLLFFDNRLLYIK
jgi:uncharacterized protein YneF (UPF0154 family)